MSSNYIVSARKYRPTSFDSVVGQQSLTHTLKTAIASGRLAHAYLFCGPRGVGKTTCARIFAKTINCLNPTAEGEACNECESCRAFNEQQSYNITELDAASNNSVDDIRNITDQVRIPPQGGRYRVFIIDEVHMLSNQAFNAFLKTLEEPPEYAIFILATTEKQKVIPTILSRCQIYDFARITVPDIVQQLQRIAADQGVEAAPEALNVIAQKADGAMRDALSIFDQVVASTRGHITYQDTINNLNVLDYDYYFRLVQCAIEGDVPGALLIYKEVRDKGFDSLFFINGLAAHLRDLMVAQVPSTRSLLEMDATVSERYLQQASEVNAGFLYRAVDLCCTCDLNYRDATSKQLLVELTLVKLCQILKPLEATRGDNPVKIQPITATADTVGTPTPVTHAQTVIPKSNAATTAPVSNADVPNQTTASHSPRVPRRVAGTSTVRISSNNVAEEQQTSQANTVRRNNYTDEQLLDAWKDYINTHHNEQVIITLMRNHLPVRVGEDTYLLTVASDAEVSIMEDNKPKWLTALRDALENDMIAFNFAVDQTQETRRIMSPQEVARDLSARYDSFKKLVTDFDLKLA